MEYDKEFIKPEIRCDWEVTEEQKKIWWVQLDLLKLFQNICDTHHLRWYPLYGTLLGAVRHKGFIPWDDDVDLAMPRADFDRFVKICRKELSYPYFLQSTLTDEDCFYTWVALCNSETTGNRISCLSKRQNNGIRIDIMPLDGCEKSSFWFKLNRFPIRVATVICNTYANEFNMGKKAVLLRKILRKGKINYKRGYQWIEAMNRRYTWDKYHCVTFRALNDPHTGTGRQMIWDKEIFRETKDCRFENLVVPIPVGYDRMLKQVYGNYLDFPPLTERQGEHNVIFKPDIPYKTYCAEMYGVDYGKR